jgi:hypothetical protein
MGVMEVMEVSEQVAVGVPEGLSEAMEGTGETDRKMLWAVEVVVVGQ